jgi:hypothetical protein
MAILDMNSEVSHLRAEEERILASFTQRLIEIASVAGAPGSGTSPTAALNAMRLPAIAIDQHGFVVDVNTTADVVLAIAHVLIPGGVGIGQELAWLRKFDSGIAS